MKKQTESPILLIILLGFSSYSSLVLAELAAYILLCMTGNPVYVTPAPALADIQELLDIYNTAITAAKSRDSQAVLDKQAARTNLIISLQALGRYVMATATTKQDLGSSGFPLSKRGQPVPPMPAPTNFTIADGNLPYSIKASVDGSSLIKTFMFQVTDAPPTKDTIWINEPSTVKEFLFTNLLPEKRYWFRVILVGSRKQMQYSEPLTRLVQ